MSKRLNETQIVGILKEAEAGTPVPELCRKYGVGNDLLPKISTMTRMRFPVIVTMRRSQHEEETLYRRTDYWCD